MTITKNVWKAAALLLILSLISAVMISGTYARYTSEFAGEDTALVAKWNIVATGGGIGLTDGVTAPLNLFGHTYDTNIATLPGENLIAPGVAGEFTLQFQNNSDVDAQITFEIATTSAINVPIKYSLTSGGAILTLPELKTALDSTFNDVGFDAAPVSQTVFWRWAYAGDDAVDTALGTGSYASDIVGDRTSYGLMITASAVQVVPATE